MVGTILKPDTRNSLALAPSAPAVIFPQPRDFPDGRTNGESLDMGDFADDFEIHKAMLSKCPARVKRGHARSAQEELLSLPGNTLLHSFLPKGG